MNKSYVYFMSNTHNNVLYIGVTSDLNKRIIEHMGHDIKGSFSDRYNCTKLVYYEEFNNIRDAIAREKQLKSWKREWKNQLIESQNPCWCDLMNGD